MRSPPTQHPDQPVGLSHRCPPPPSPASLLHRQGRPLPEFCRGRQRPENERRPHPVSLLPLLLLLSHQQEQCIIVRTPYATAHRQMQRRRFGVSLVCSCKICADFILLTRTHFRHPSRPLTWSTRRARGMACRDERRRLSERTGRAGEFCVISIYCAHFHGYLQLTPVVPPML